MAAILAVAACTDPSSVDPSTALVVGSARYEIVSGDQQSAPAGAELPAPLVVRVTNASGAAVPGQLVNWVITEGDGSVFAGRAITDEQGVAHEWWTLGATPGPNALEVRAVDSGTGEALVFGRFRATGTDSTVAEEPAPPTTISVSARSYKVKGLQKVDLGWSGASSSSVDIHRDGGLLVRSPNDGSHLDHIDRKGTGSYRYRVCEVGGTVCSGEVQVNF
ncbi:MAG TPA: Ig-like domain-containing protein [Longimicrobiaceae bacterium]